MYTYNRFTWQQKLTQHCQPNILQKKKKKDNQLGPTAQCRKCCSIFYNNLNRKEFEKE